MTSKHTPGPWIIKENFVVAEFPGASATFVAKPLHVRIDNGAGDVSKALANARLIAAAPELLEALKDLCTLAGGYGASPDDLRRALSNAEAVVKKAEGR